MQLYKSRDFGALFQDTFSFLKQNGKHFFKQFFIVNGVFLLILLALGYAFTKFYSELVFGGVLQNNPNAFDDYMNENFGIFVLLFIAFLFIGLIAALIAYAFVPIYLQLYNKQSNTNFGTKAIVDQYKKHLGKLFTFLICGIVIGIPFFLAMGIVGFIMAITIVGVLGLPFLIAMALLFYSMTLMEYLENKRGIWDSFGYAWTLMRSKFIPAVGCVGLFYFMSYILQNIITMIPYFFFMASFIVDIENQSANPQELGATLTIVMLAVFFLAFIVGAVLNNIVQLNQGIVFYSLKEDNEHINTKHVIDQIGSGE